MTNEEVEQNMYEAMGLHIQGLLEDGLAVPQSRATAEYIVIK